MTDALCRKVSISGLGLAAGLWFAGALYAAGFSAAPVDYSADRYMSGEGGATMAGKIYYSPGKERMECTPPVSWLTDASPTRLVTSRKRVPASSAALIPVKASQKYQL